MSLFLLLNQFNIWYGILLAKTRSFRKMFKQLLILGLTFVASRYKSNTRNSPILYFLSCRTQEVCAKSLQSCLTLQSYALQSTRIFCPWDSPGKNIRVGCHALLQEIFQTQGLNPRLLCLLDWQVSSSPLAPPGNRRQDSLI